MKNKTKQRILYFCICLLFLAEACISSAKVYYSAVILDKAQAGDLSGMLFSIFLAVSACLGLFLVDYLNTRSKLAYMTSIELELKHNIVHAMLHRPMQAFREKDDAYYFNLLTTDVDTYRNDFIGSRLMLISWVFYGISAAAMLCKLHPMLLLAGLVLAIIPIFTNNLFTAISQKAKTVFPVPRKPTPALSRSSSRATRPSGPTMPRPLRRTGTTSSPPPSAAPPLAIPSCRI